MEYQFTPGPNGRCTIRFLKILMSECPDIWYVYQNTSGQKSWSSMEDPVVPLEGNLHGRPLTGKVLLKNTVGRRFCSLTEKKRLFLSDYVDCIKNWLERN